MALVEPHKYCRGCKHLYISRNAQERYYACIYILHTHTKRPCPAGKGCTVRERVRPGDRADAMRNIIARDCASAAYDGKSKV